MILIKDHIVDVHAQPAYAGHAAHACLALRHAGPCLITLCKMKTCIVNICMTWCHACRQALVTLCMSAQKGRAPQGRAEHDRAPQRRAGLHRAGRDRAGRDRARRDRAGHDMAEHLVRQLHISLGGQQKGNAC